MDEPKHLQDVLESDTITFNLWVRRNWRKIEPCDRKWLDDLAKCEEIVNNPKLSEQAKARLRYGHFLGWYGYLLNRRRVSPAKRAEQRSRRGH